MKILSVGKDVTKSWLKDLLGIQENAADWDQRCRAVFLAYEDAMAK